MKQDLLNIDPKLSPTAVVLRVALIGGILVGAAALFAYARGWFTPRALTQDRVIDTFQKVNGVYSGFRRNHAKGVCFRGWFESNGNGVELSKAAVFPAGRIPVIGRFSLAGGQPYVADAPTAVRAMALQLQLPNGEEWRMAMIDLPVFPVQTMQQFAVQLEASIPDPATGKPDPAKMKAFVEANPDATRALGLIQSRAISSGFADDTYRSVNTFLFRDRQGRTIPVRWAMIPEQSFQPPPKDDPGKADANYLFDALIAAVRQGPQRWRLVVTIGEPGDPTNDASIPWPDDRRSVDVGTLVIDRIESEAESPARDMNFDPTILPEGIAVSDDPLLSARSAAYSVSFTRREGEPKKPSAITTAEVEK
jgi:Catalase